MNTALGLDLTSAFAPAVADESVLAVASVVDQEVDAVCQRVAVVASATIIGYGRAKVS